MHFWINKPAGRSRMIGGCRRYPASSASIPTSSTIPASIPLLKTRSRSQRSRSEGSSSMVSPGINLNWNCNQRANQNQRYPVDNNINPVIRNEEIERGCNSHRGQQTINIANNVANATHVQRVVPNDRGIIDVSEIGGAELAGYRLRCGVWITFVLATGFVSIAKFYFGHRPDKGLDVLIFCGLLVTLLLSGCFYSTLFRRRATPDHRHPVPEIQITNHTARILINDDENLTTVISGNSSPTLVPSSPTAQVQQQVHRLNSQTLVPSAPPLPSPSPPPYHIAILIPPTNSPYEAPPPSYEKAIR